MTLNAPLSAILCDLIVDRRTDVCRALLLEPDIDVNHQTPAGATPLLLAAEQGLHRLVPLLLALGADPNATDSFGRTPLMRAARNGDTRIVSILLGQGAAVNLATRKRGWTALMWAATSGSTACVRALLDAGANPALTNSAGQTALDITRESGSRTTEKLLLERMLTPT